MRLAGWRSCDKALGWPKSYTVLSVHGLVEGDGPSFRKKFLSVRLRYQRLLSDHQAWNEEADLSVNTIAVICANDDMYGQEKWSKNQALRHSSS